jgi:hypothetical protein
MDTFLKSTTFLNVSQKNENNFALIKIHDDDTVFDDTTSTYWILDCMTWKQTSLYDTATEFRLYWLYQQLMEECPSAASPPPPASHQKDGSQGGATTTFPLRLCPYYDCSPEGLRAAYEVRENTSTRSAVFILMTFSSKATTTTPPTTTTTTHIALSTLNSVIYNTIE